MQHVFLTIMNLRWLYTISSSPIKGIHHRDWHNTIIKFVVANYKYLLNTYIKIKYRKLL